MINVAEGRREGEGEADIENERRAAAISTQLDFWTAVRGAGSAHRRSGGRHDER